jgi:hypothetical protein
MLVDRLEIALKAALARRQVVLPGKVRAVGKPQAENVAVDLGHDLAAFQHVIQRPLLDAGIGVAKRAELVLVILEDIGVDRADGDAAFLRILAHGGVILVGGLIPGNVNGNRRRHAGQLVHHSSVVQLLLCSRRRPPPGKRLEARAAVGIAPTRRFDLLLLQRRLNRRHIQAIRLELLGENIIGCLRSGHKVITPAICVCF